jgi:hypothetical protein
VKTTEHKTLQKVSVLTLVGIVVGSIVGGGVFTLRRSFGSATGVLGAIIAWIIAGTGMLMLAFVFSRWLCVGPILIAACTSTPRRDSGTMRVALASACVWLFHYLIVHYLIAR